MFENREIQDGILKAVKDNLALIKENLGLIKELHEDLAMLFDYLGLEIDEGKKKVIKKKK